jgi:GntR family transcriptional regulator
MNGYPQASSLVYTIPMYIQIAEGLMSQIEARSLIPGQQLPSERELSLQLNVNRMTLRRALRVLELQGFIVRKHGVGTFVAEPKIVRQMEEVYRFSYGVQQRGLTPGARIISLETCMLEAAMAEELMVPVSSPAYRILRLRSINQEPVLIENYTIPMQRFPGFIGYDLEGRSLFEIMDSEYGVKITRAHQSFEPVVASSFEAELLGVELRAPLMLESRLSFDEQSHPVEVGRDRYRGDRFRFVTEAVPFELRSSLTHPPTEGDHR